MSEIIVTNKNSIQEIIREEVKKALVEFSQWLEAMIIDTDRIYTREETIKYLGISPSTLNRWTKEGKIKAFGIGDRVYYKHIDIQGALVAIN